MVLMGEYGLGFLGDDPGGPCFDPSQLV
jgi:hypothetical protein